MKLCSDPSNETLISLVRPPDWVNPKPAPYYNLVVIGAGTAGLVSAAIAANLGAKVALIEKRMLGGDCLNFGCVPSKALIRASKACDEISRCSRFGIDIDSPMDLKTASVMKWVRSVRSIVSVNDSVRKFTELGVDVFIGEACFAGPNQVSVGNSTLNFRKAVICTGTHPIVPDIPGLNQDACLTNETVFELDTIPERLAVIGAGPVGCELTQGLKVRTYRRDMTEVDREITDGAQDGFIKLVIEHNSDKIIGATVVGQNAGELIDGVTLAIRNRLGMKSISFTIYPYPTQSLAIKRAADKYVGGRLTPKLKWILGKWFWLSRIL